MAAAADYESFVHEITQLAAVSTDQQRKGMALLAELDSIRREKRDFGSLDQQQQLALVAVLQLMLTFRSPACLNVVKQ